MHLHRCSPQNTTWPPETVVSVSPESWNQGPILGPPLGKPGCSSHYATFLKDLIQGLLPTWSFCQPLGPSLQGMLAFPEKWLMGSKGTHRATQSKTGFLPSFSGLWSQIGAVNFQGGKIIRYINYWYTGSKFTLFAREMDQGPWNSFPLPDAMRLSSFVNRRCWRQTFASGGCAHSAGAIVASPVLNSPGTQSSQHLPLLPRCLWETLPCEQVSLAPQS